MPTIEEEKPYVPSTIDTVSNSTEAESNVVEITLTNLPQTNPLAKLISNMLPNATPFVPNSTSNQNGPVPLAPGIVNSMMNNDASPFIPNQHQNSMNSHYMPNNSSNPNHWGGRGGVGGGGNRRGQTGVSYFPYNGRVSSMCCVYREAGTITLVTVINDQVCSYTSYHYTELAFFQIIGMGGGHWQPGGGVHHKQQRRGPK